MKDHLHRNVTPIFLELSKNLECSAGKYGEKFNGRYGPYQWSSIVVLGLRVKITFDDSNIRIFGHVRELQNYRQYYLDHTD